MDAFASAFQQAVSGALVPAIAALQGTRNLELNSWFDVHAQNSGTFRAKHFGPRGSSHRAPDLDPQRQVTRFEKKLFARDGYRCRYCAVRVVPGTVTKRMESLLGKDMFDATSRSNSARHGIKLAFSAALDHVVPHSQGGRTDAENLVTCCWACNYGKADYTLKELGLIDPRRFDPIVDDWMGLTE